MVSPIVSFSLSFSFSLRLVVHNLIKTDTLDILDIFQNRPCYIKLILRLLLGFCELFCQIQPDVAYKKACNSEGQLSKVFIEGKWLDFNTCLLFDPSHPNPGRREKIT